jgi:hypothetical protein
MVDPAPSAESLRANAMFEWMELVIALGVFLSGIIITGVNARHAGRSQTEEAHIAGGYTLIDQLQEELKTMRQHVDRLECRDRVYLPHILRLNSTIERLGGTPPRLPKILLDYLDDKEEQ